MLDIKYVLNQMILQVPDGVDAIYFCLPTYLIGKINERCFDGYKFNYSKYLPNDYFILSEKEYRDEDIFWSDNDDYTLKC